MKKTAQQQEAVAHMIAAVEAGRHLFANPETKTEKLWERGLIRVFEDLQMLAEDLSLECDPTYDPLAEKAEKRAKKSAVLDLIRVIRRALVMR